MRPLHPPSDSRRITHVGTRVRNLERRIIGTGDATGGPGPWIYVGTPTQTAGQVDALGNSVPTLIAANPAPYNVSPWVPFQNGWNNSLGDDPPLSFAIDSDGIYLYLRGGYAGGTDLSTIYTLPTGFRPPYRTPLIAAYSDFSDIAQFIVNPNGTVVDAGGF
jgi:hypothetical protein